MTKLFLALVLAVAGALFFRLQGSFREATEFLFAAAMVWGLSFSLLISSLSEWKRTKSNQPAE